ncbi:DUF2382 domain-containing protein [Cumulibacter manganitolerans]|uniref:DUF2382 domain-containing protein n=1 Tax=Cumulibacter manganitolerans TaxID=1884992 RepID=UPI001295EC17|nr:PRC and DUF2382 domain-containing protein [Cumulibacter manganitolerans]
MAHDRNDLTSRDSFDELLDAKVYDRDGDKIGSVGTLYTDDDSGRPSWVTVNTGLFGTNETFVPLREARVSGDEIHVPYEKSYVKDAPNVAADQHLSLDEERRLYEYYTRGGDGIRHDGAAVGDGARVGRDSGIDRDREAVVDDGDTGEGVVRREERLDVGTEERETGRLRLRKHVVTERENVEVPVRREEVRVERTPIADGETVRGGNASLSEEEVEVPLHEERPVIEKETVPVERIDVDKRTVQDTENVQADVQKEQVEIEETGVRDDRTDRL